jgi:hypothetical protein
MASKYFIRRLVVIIGKRRGRLFQMTIREDHNNRPNDAVPQLLPCPTERSLIDPR